MKRFTFARLLAHCTGLVLTGLAAGSTFLGAAQGTVNLTNIRAPLTDCQGDLLGPGYTAQLRLTDGTAVGSPTPIIANGLFSGGVQIVADVPGGETLDLKLAVFDPKDEFYAETLPFTLISGGHGIPPALPPMLPDGLQLDCTRPPVFSRDLDLTFVVEETKAIDLLLRPYSLAPPGWFAVPEDRLTFVVQPAGAL